MKFFLTLIIFCLALVVTFIFWAKHTNLKVGMNSQKIVSSNNEFDSKEIKLMSWNLGFAYGVGSEGVGYKKLTLAQMNEKLEQAVNVISKHSPDIVIFQEIDFDSSRSHNIDQLEFIAKKLGFEHYAYAVSWEKNYLPFPYFPVENQWGKINSGGAVMSRFPILSNQVTLYDLPTSNAFWYNWFYLFRYTQVVKIKLNNQVYNILNSHIEAFDKPTRVLQANQISNIARELHKSGEKILLVGGDLNTTPPNAKIKNNFEQDSKENYENDQTYEAISKLGFLTEVVNLDDYVVNEPQYFTFSSAKPDRRLDYLFIGDDFEIGAFEVDRNQVSDHFPIISKIKLKN